MKANCKKMFMVLAVSVLCLLAGMFVSPMKAEAATKAKVVLEFSDGTKKTWRTGDKKIALGKKKLTYVYFGEYPKTEVTGKKLTEAIKNAEYNKNGIATIKGVKYKRISREDVAYVYDSSVDGEWAIDIYYDWAGKSYVYFKLEPIKWRVLSNKKGTVLLLSEYGIDTQRYNEEFNDITWERCTLRAWLNGKFLKTAFNVKERKLIKTVKVKNDDNTHFGSGCFAVEGGNDTKDKIYILSFDDIVNTKYGFASDLYEYDTNRRCSSTDFAKAMGAFTAYSEKEYASDYKTYEGKWANWWWLRSPGRYSDMAAYMYNDGSAYDIGFNVDYDNITVRPTLKLNLSSVIG